MSLLDGIWKYAQSDWPAPILHLPAGASQSAEFEQLAKIGLVREGQRQRAIQCPLCWEPCDEPLASPLPDGTLHFMLACPNCGGVDVSADELRNWRIHFSALPGMLSMRLGMREPQQVVRDALWKLGRYGESGDIWMARWLRNPEAKDWLAQMPKTPETILLYLGPPPDFSLLADMPQGNVIDASELITVTDDGLHVNMEPVEAALRQSAHASAASTSSFSFRKEGDYWRLVFGGKSALVKDTKGMLYIRHLLEIAPKQESTLQLRRVADPDFQPEFVGSGEETMDELELKQINDRLVAIDSELDAAKDIQDFGTQTDLVEERESLREHLRVSLGLGGRIRKDDDDLERNRKTVGNAITTAIKNIAAIHPELGRHLKAHISKGDQCGYRLEQGMVWST